MATSIWAATGVTPAATDRLPVDTGAAGSASRWTGQQVADINTLIGGTVTALGSINSATALNLALGGYFTATITGNLTFSITNVPASAGVTFVLALTNGGAYTVTLPGSVTIIGGSALLQAAGTDWLIFRTTNGGTAWSLEVVGNPRDAELAAIAGLTSAADKGLMFSGAGTAATFDLTAAARTVLDDTTTAAMLTTLGAQAALVSGTNIKTINSTSLLGSGDIAISASPGGSTLQPQYNAAGSFAGMAGVSWDDTNRAETRTGATVTTSNPVQSFTQTWNAAGVTFTGWKLNVTNTASASGSLLADWQVGGVSQAKLRKDGWLFLADGAGIAGITATTTGIQVNYGGNNPDINIFTNSTERALFYGNGVAFSGSIQIGSATKYGGDVFLSRNASGVAEFTNGSTGTFRDLKLRTLIASETVKLASYTVATVPSASTSGAGATIYVSDETGGAVVAFSDATNWRRVTDRAVIS